MNISFKECLEKRRIFPFNAARHLINLELSEAQNDLLSAEEELNKSGFKWATIKGYYSMYHSARALLYSQGYREKGHYCLYIAIKTLFAEQGKIDKQLVENLKNSMILREDADYRSKFSKKGAEATIEIAKNFFKETKSILKKEKS